jgi:hypothetical protein
LLPVRVAEVALEGLDRSRIYVDLVGLPKEEAKRRLLAGVRAERAKPSIEPGFPQRVDHPPTASEARTGVVGRAMNLEPGRGQDRPAVQHVSKATLEPATTTHNLQLRRERAGAILENEMQAASEPVVGFTPRLTPASHTGRVASLRRMASLCALAGLETAAVLSLHWLGRFGSLQVDWREPVLWLTASPLQDVIGAVIRTIGLILAYWLLASTLLYLVADLTRLPAVMRAVRPIIQPLFQRLTNSLRQVLQRISKNDGG